MAEGPGPEAGRGWRALRWENPDAVEGLPAVLC
jgi:hypothetical protein